MPQDIIEMQLTPAERSLLLRYGRYSESFRSQDEAALTNLYQTNGFRNAKLPGVLN